MKGKLLLAGAGLWDPNFRRTVVLVGEHNDDGALGVVLNRPSPAAVADLVPPLVGLVEPDDPLYFGGPVQPEGAVILGQFERPERPDLLVFGTIGFLIGDVPSEAVQGLQRARVYAGYAGWGPGQLEREMEEESWIPEPATEADVFTDRPEDLWSAVLRRKGAEFAILSTMPFDPSSN